MKKTCSTCWKSEFTSCYCGASKYIECKHSDRSDGNVGKVSYWEHSRSQKCLKVAKRATNKPMAEISWVREGFKFVIDHQINADYKTMWRCRRDAVLAVLHNR
jgi:hypothetical protein